MKDKNKNMKRLKWETNEMEEGIYYSHSPHLITKREIEYDNINLSEDISTHMMYDMEVMDGNFHIKKSKLSGRYILTTPNDEIIHLKKLATAKKIANIIFNENI